MDESTSPPVEADPLTEALRARLRHAVSLLSSGQARQALNAVVEGLTFFPDSADLCNLAGNCAITLGNHASAEQYWRQSIALDPNKAQPHFSLGLLYANLQRNEEAERCYRKSIAADPGNPAAYSNLGALLAGRKSDTEAEQCFRQALALDPGNAMAYFNLGLLLAKHNRHADAEQCYRKTIALDPRSVVAHSALGVLLALLGRDEEAEQYLRQTLLLNPHYALARLNLAHLLLRQGRFVEGWQHHEIRYSPNLPDQHKLPHTIRVPFPQWQGEPLTGKSLLVWPEQGFGDEIQFCRYLPVLKKQGATHITLVCKTPLKALMATLEGADKVIAFDESSSAIAPHDFWTYPLSLPLHCKTALATIPANIPYLHASPEYMTKWSARVPSDGFRVGLVWKGNALHKNDGYRSLPGLATLAPLWSVPDIHFISLQKEQGEDEALRPPAGQPLLPLGHEIDDFSDTAAIVAQLDLVICVDTAVAHLAGAMGKRCWVLLPAHRTDWRWLRGRGDSPWYPGVMRLFRQRNGEDWAPIVQEIKIALSCEANKKNKSPFSKSSRLLD